MNWLRPASLAAFAVAASLSVVFACSSDDSGNDGGLSDLDASQTPIPKIEAGAPCSTDNDCADGLSCLYPATTCQAYRVCTTTPANPCAAPQAACSCLGETIQVCGGFADDPIASMGACGDGGVVVVPDAGPHEGGASDASDAGDSSSPVDSGPDADDGATE